MIRKMTLEERLDKAEKLMNKPSFRQNKGLGNEVGYYVFDYPAEKELVVRERIDYLRRKNEQSDDAYKLAVFDLYDIVIEILQEKGYLEKCFAFEQKNGFDRITKAVGQMLRITGKDSLLIIYIEERTPEKAIILLTGIGKCYPVLRAHTLLNNLHQVIDRVPVVMFYPGTYNGQELILFDEIKDDNYYRAFPLVE